jgi:hypothetical protein
MQFYQQRYPRVVKLKKQESGLVVVEDIHSGAPFAFDHPHFSTIYEQMSLRLALEALSHSGENTSLGEIHRSLCSRQGTTMLDRMVLVVALSFSVLALLAGITDSRVLRILFILVRLSAAHGTTLERILIHQQLGDDGA